VQEAVWSTDLAGLPPPRRGKVRDVYDLGDTLLLVATDRLSAYDHVLRPAIPGKGKVLTQLSNFWFEHLAGIVPNHLLAISPADFPSTLHPHAALLEGRAVLVRKTAVVPFECVARGYLAGSGFREYRQSAKVCGIPLRPGLELASRLPEPIFTPATKATEGHDENVDFATMAAATGEGVAQALRRLALQLYGEGAAWAGARGLILADTQFEMGHDGARLLLIDEALTPDSSRYWDAATWRPGQEPASFDKQFVRNWLDATGWDRQSPPPELPPEVVRGTLERYVTAFRRLTGREPRL
jgi:phosphoribosylaminoimidazole-succinocarboxamide synthase